MKSLQRCREFGASGARGKQIIQEEQCQGGDCCRGTRAIEKAIEIGGKGKEGSAQSSHAVGRCCRVLVQSASKGYANMLQISPRWELSASLGSLFFRLHYMPLNFSPNFPLPAPTFVDLVAKFLDSS